MSYAAAVSTFSCTVGNSQLSLAWVAPTDTGGYPITSYQYSIDGGTTYTTIPDGQITSPYIITSLTNGTAYSVALRAITAFGNGITSRIISSTPTATAAAIPGAPTALISAPDSGQLSIGFIVGAENGSTITNYKYSTDNGATYTLCSTETWVSPIIITGLTNYTAYTIKLKAVNVLGDSVASTAIIDVPTIETLSVTESGIIQNTVAGSNTVLTVANNATYITNNMKYIQIGWYAYAATSSMEKVGTVIANDANRTITIGSVLKNADNLTTGGFSLSNNQYYFFAKPDIGVSPLTTYNGTTGYSNTFSGFSNTDQTTGNTAKTTSWFSVIKVGWTCHQVSHIRPRGIVTNVDIATKTITLDRQGFLNTSNFYFFMENSKIPIYRPVIGGKLISTIISPTKFQISCDNSQRIGLDYNIYNTTDLTTIVGTVNFVDNAGNVYLATGTVSAGNKYLFVHPLYSTSAICKNTGATNSSIATYTADNFTSTPGLGKVSTGWQTLSYTTFFVYKSSVVSNNYPTSNTITTSSSNLVNNVDTIYASHAVSPDAPTISSCTSGDATISVAFTAPAYYGTAAITSYQYSTDAGTTYTSISQTTSPIVITNLVNGVLTTVLLKAVNSVGAGTASNAVATTPTGPVYVPNSPTSVVATSADPYVSVAFTAPSNIGGGAITNYAYSIDGGSTYITASPAQSTSPLLISGLTSDVSYTIKIKAINSAGDGTASNSTTITFVSASTVPDAPTSLVATAENTQISLAFSAPTNNGGVAITNYSYSTDDGITYTAASPSQTSSPLLLTGLTNGVAYTISIKAINSIGASVASSSIIATPIAAPDAPTSLSAAFSDGALSISFTAGAINGSAITNYVYSIDNGTTYTAFVPAQTSSPVSITGLTNGTAYTVRIKAVNIMGYSAASASVTQTPAGVPGAPSALVATITGNTTVNVAFTAGAENGADVTNYMYSLDSGVSYTAFSPAQITPPLTISGLTLGNSYSITLKEIDAGGISLASTAVAVEFTSPNIPTGLHATTEPNKTTIAFVSPSPGGALITNYEYSLDGGATFAAFSPAQTSSPVSITGLSDSASYDIQFKAVNIIGKSAASSTVSIMPATPPPETVAYTQNEASVVVLPTTVKIAGVVVDIVKYWYSIDFGITWLDPSNVVSIANLTNGVSYTIWYYAETAVGFGPTYVTSVTPTPSAPSAPTITTITPNTVGTELSIYFTAPVSNGGFAITDYQYTIDNGTTIVAAGQTTSPIVVSGTIRNQVYPTAIAAVNSVGVGESSTIVVIKTFLPCFGEGTWIKCKNGYQRIESLAVGDMVCTLKHGLVPIHTIGSRDIMNSIESGRTPDHMYICFADVYPEVFEDLILTGYHALLESSVSTELKEKVKALYSDMLYMTDGMVRVPVCADARATLHPAAGEKFTIYNFALEAPDIYTNYGVYANGLLVETSSIRFMTDLADMVHNKD